MSYQFPYLIIGGGIAGITCAETLNLLDENVAIGLITCSDTVKSVTDLHRITKTIEDFNIVEKSINDMSKLIPNLTIFKGIVDFINPNTKSVNLMDGRKMFYEKLCVCTGGKPKLIVYDNPFVLGLRDTESVQCFKEKLSGCKRVAIIGNGGIATELVYEVADCELLWLVKDKYISANFIDEGAARFLLDSMSIDAKPDAGAQKVNIQRHHYTVEGKSYTMERKLLEDEKYICGGALGPDWALHLKMKGHGDRKLEVLYEVEVISIETDREKVVQFWKETNPVDSPCDYLIALRLSDGSVHFCDLIVSATGVTPQYPRLIDAEWKVSVTDGAILIGENMNTNIDGLYAAGDCCSANWDLAEHWFQMRLWSQARNMAFQAAKSMFASLNNQPAPWLDFSFELFTHVTKFFGYSVILLGLYNGQKLQLANNDKAELLIRTSPGMEYIKCVIVDGRIRGAMLIGDTEMAETLEDLILDEIDVTQFGEHLLDPEIDIVDYFD